MARPRPLPQDAELRAIFRHSLTERLSHRLMEGGGALIGWIRFYQSRAGNPDIDPVLFDRVRREVG